MGNFSLQACGVTKYFLYPRYQCILHNFSASFHAGVMTVITGSSGAGKSTLLTCIAGIEAIDHGVIWYGNAHISHMSRSEIACLWHQHLAIVLQEPHLLTEISIYDNVAVKGYIAGDHSVIHHRVDTVLDEVGLAAYRDAYPDELSGGQQQRVALARALLYPPAFIITDEPTAHLDDENAHALLSTLQRYRDNHGCGVIIASHDHRVIKQADAVCHISA